MRTLDSAPDHPLTPSRGLGRQRSVPRLASATPKLAESVIGEAFRVFGDGE
jgi:hypothetical protein